MPKATKDFAVERKKLSDLTPDKRNANRGTQRGAQAIAQSLKDYGAGRSILLDKHGIWHSRGGSVVYEPFCGTGTTVIACEKTMRRCHAMEISPSYVDVIVERWQNATGKKAVLDGAA